MLQLALHENPSDAYLLLLVLGGGILLAGSLGTGAVSIMFSTAQDLSALAAGTYALSAAVVPSRRTIGKVESV